VPYYCYKCPSCNHTSELLTHFSDRVYGVACSVCGHDMKRDYVAEKVSSDFHPTKDVYATSLKQRRPRREG
jgi:predicted nucleic acid-binding Zn ribbon protein